MNNQNIIYAQDNFFVRLNILNYEGMLLFTNPLQGRLAISRNMLENLAYIFTHNRGFPRYELNQFFGIYIYNWFNDARHNPNITQNEAQIFRNRIIAWFVCQGRRQLQNFIIDQSSSTSGAYIVINFLERPLEWQLEIFPWNNQINFDNC